MKILIACEESQAVCIAMRELGHEAYSCDLQDCSGGHPEWHIKGDALKLLKQPWDMIIAHPPCTYLTKASACRLYCEPGKIDPKRAANMVKARIFFEKFLDCDCPRVAIENPTPLKVTCLPKPTQIIQPYEFGHPYSKRTCLWLKGLPPLVPTEIVTEHTPWMPSNTGWFARGRGGARGKAHDPKTASKTFTGIARAMAQQWAGRKE